MVNLHLTLHSCLVDEINLFFFFLYMYETLFSALFCFPACKAIVLNCTWSYQFGCHQINWQQFFSLLGQAGLRYADLVAGALQFHYNYRTIIRRSFCLQPHVLVLYVVYIITSYSIMYTYKNEKNILPSNFLLQWLYILKLDNINSGFNPCPAEHCYFVWKQCRCWSADFWSWSARCWINIIFHSSNNKWNSLKIAGRKSVRTPNTIKYHICCNYSPWTWSITH